MRTSGRDADSADAILDDALRALAAFDPELWTDAGVAGFEARVVDVGAGRARRFREAVAPLLARIAHRSLAASPDEDADLQLLDAALRNAVKRSDLEGRLAPHVDLVAIAADGVMRLLDRGTPAARRAAVARLRAYAGSSAGAGALETLDASLGDALRDPDALLPSRGRLEGALAAAPGHLAALRARLAAEGVAEALPLVDELARQYRRHEALLKGLAARAPLTQPVEVELLEQTERELGVEGRSDALVERARATFGEAQRALREEAAAYASARGRGGEPFGETLASIRSRLPRAGEEADAYRAALDALRAILASDLGAPGPGLAVEVRASARPDLQYSGSPHLAPADDPARALLVVPQAGHDVAPEYRCAAAAWVFSAREGIPGRALRNAAIPSRARSFFGSPVAGEGWTSYAEWLVRPRLPAEARLLSLELELLRTARVLAQDALLRGASPEGLVRFLVDEVGASAPLAAAEIDGATGSPAYAALAHVGLLGWLELDRVAAERDLERGEFVARALRAAMLPPPLAAATIFARRPQPSELTR